MGLVARLVDQHRDDELLQLFPHLRDVVDHCGFHGEAAGTGQDALKVGRVVFSRVEDFPRVHRRPRARDIPVARLRPRKPDAAEPVERVEEAHRRGGDEVDVFDRPAKDGDLPIDPLRGLAALRDGEEAAAVRNGDQRIAAGIVIHAEIFRVPQFHAALGQPAVAERPRAPGGRGPGAA